MVNRKKVSKEVERLIDSGFTEVKDLMKRTGLSERQCYRYIGKYRKTSEYRFNNLMTTGGEYAFQYYSTIDNFNKTIQECNEEIERVQREFQNMRVKILGAIENLILPKQALTQSAMLGHLVQLESARETILVRLISQRDKATESKAKTLNQGPVVASLRNLVRKYPDIQGELVELNMGDGNIEQAISPTGDEIEITADDVETLKEMEEDE